MNSPRGRRLKGIIGCCAFSGPGLILLIHGLMKSRADDIFFSIILLGFGILFYFFVPWMEKKRVQSSLSERIKYLNEVEREKKDKNNL